MLVPSAVSSSSPFCFSSAMPRARSARSGASSSPCGISSSALSEESVSGARSPSRASIQSSGAGSSMPARAARSAYSRQRFSRASKSVMMRSSSSSEVASRGIAKLSPIPSAGAPSRSGYSRNIQVSTKPSAEIAAAARKTGRSASMTAVMYSSCRLGGRPLTAEGITLARNSIPGPASCACRPLAKIAPNSATPSAPPSERNSMVPEVATPRCS